MRKVSFGMVFLLFMLSLSAVSVAPAQAQGLDNSVTGALNRDPRFSLFAAALQTSGLADDLQVRTRTYTVFAPTNDAFATLGISLGLSPQQVVQDRSLVRRIVQYHILGGEFSLGRTLQEDPLEVFTFSNDPMRVDFINNRIEINQGEAVVIQPNVFVDNGVIHVINRLLLPPGTDIDLVPVISPSGNVLPPPVFVPGTILEVASRRGDLSTFVNAVVAAGLVDALNSPNLTVFAPTNGAFNTLLGNLGTSQQTLLQNTDLLTNVLTFHVSPQRYSAGDLAQISVTTTGPTLNGNLLPGGTITGAAIPTLNFAPLPISPGGTTIRLNNGQATVQQPDIQATNGVIHVIDNVLVP